MYIFKRLQWFSAFQISSGNENLMSQKCINPRFQKKNDGFAIIFRFLIHANIQLNSFFVEYLVQIFTEWEINIPK